MNAVPFYILAILVVAAAAAAVAAPRIRDAAAALLVFAVATAVLVAATGAYLVAVAEVIVVVVGSGAILWLLRRGGYRGLARAAPLVPPRWWLGAGVGFGIGALLVVVFVASGADWFQGSGQASLITVLHYQEPYALVIAVVLAAFGLGGGFLLGRVGDDERETDAMIAARRHREERVRLRREAREAARRARREAPAAGGGG
ncbi:MAG: hypothetical protein JOY80_05080 [Candidatus Dormibacteraeota bacterium]|nr:hypothetical protein [Candidatus Dormibacteraeota bacterium]